MAWNTEHCGVAAAPLAAIDWSVTAMTKGAGRFAWAGTWDLPRAAAAVSETVWQVTLIDATLVRYHRRGYENTMSGLGPGLRRKTEETLAGLRYVRNQLGRTESPADPAEFIRPGYGTPSGSGGAAWIWRPMPEPSLKDMPASTRDWEMSRYRSYQDRLAGRDIARIFARCTAFLEQAAATASASETQPAGGLTGGQSPRTATNASGR